MISDVRAGTSIWLCCIPSRRGGVRLVMLSLSLPSWEWHVVWGGTAPIHRIPWVVISISGNKGCRNAKTGTWRFQNGQNPPSHPNPHCFVFHKVESWTKSTAHPHTVKLQKKFGCTYSFTIVKNQLRLISCLTFWEIWKILGQLQSRAMTSRHRDLIWQLTSQIYHRAHARKLCRKALWLFEPRHK